MVEEELPESGSTEGEEEVRETWMVVREKESRRSRHSWVEEVEQATVKEREAVFSKSSRAAEFHRGRS